MKSFKRLGIDPLVVYGTLCVKCPIAEPDLAPEECVRRLVEEIAIVQPKIVVVMGEPALRVLNSLEVPLSRPIEPREGEIQAFTPTIDALYTPDIDESLDEEGAKQRFWRAFKIARRVVRGPAAVLISFGWAVLVLHSSEGYGPPALEAPGCPSAVAFGGGARPCPDTRARGRSRGSSPPIGPTGVSAPDRSWGPRAAIRV